ncbi:recombinase family protein [Tumebacillus flagellatus]|uniref:Resolvase n=1 Tax=Tumebacillus flagellatus TaxID=1157490 RepID=A0A074LFE7_9BACL|nr:recombinase family protein [Tumebacillus flagellatus]KEO80966.1 hypothetical protein EL26_23345 [Tumebacillus flagellatus]
MTTTKVAIYIRVSTEEQAKEGFSIPAQKERLTQFSQSQDWDIYDFYIDEGVSAKDTNRPELQQMIKDVESGKIDIVLVYRLDRMTRSVIDLYNLLNLFEKYGTGFKSATEVYDTTTAIGRLFMTLVAALAQWERENLGERVKVAMEEKVRQGLFPGGSVPFGYRFVDGDLIVHSEEAEIIKYIYETYAKGKAMNYIAYFVSRMGVLSPSGSQQWGTNTIAYMLKNPVYCGRLRWNYKRNTENYFEVEHAYPKIITPELFEKCQLVRESRKHFGPRGNNDKYVFTGKLFCPSCGRVLVGHDSSKPKYPNNIYYRCKSREEFKTEDRCTFTSVRTDVVEEKFLSYIRHFISMDAASEVAATSEHISSGDETIQLEINRLNAEIDKLKANRAKWQRAYAEDIITLEELRERTSEDRAKEEWLVEQLMALEPPAPVERLSFDEVRQLLVDIEANWENASVEEKKEAVSILVDRIVVRGKGKNVSLEIEFN